MGLPDINFSLLEPGVLCASFVRLNYICKDTFWAKLNRNQFYTAYKLMSFIKFASNNQILSRIK